MKGLLSKHHSRKIVVLCTKPSVFRISFFLTPTDFKISPSQCICKGLRVFKNWARMIVAQMWQKPALETFILCFCKRVCRFCQPSRIHEQALNKFLKTISSLPPALSASPQTNVPCPTSRRNSLQTNQNGNARQFLWESPW